MNSFVDKTSWQTPRCWVEINLDNIRKLLQTGHTRKGYILEALLDQKVDDFKFNKKLTKELKSLIYLTMLNAVDRGCLRTSSRWLFIFKQFERKHFEKLSTCPKDGNHFIRVVVYVDEESQTLKCFGIFLSTVELSEHELRNLLGEDISCKPPSSGKIEMYSEHIRKLGKMQVFGNELVEKFHTESPVEERVTHTKKEQSAVGSGSNVSVSAL